MPFPSVRSLLLFFARFVAIYAAIFALAWSLSLFERTEGFLFEVTERQLGILEAPEIHRDLLYDDGSLVQRVSTAKLRGVKLTSAGSGYVSHNLFLFVALVLASPGLSVRQRLGAVGIGLPLIVALDVLVVMGIVWQADRMYLSQVHPGISSGTFAHVVHLISARHPTGGFFMAPVFVWGFVLLALPSFRRKLAEGAEVGRNEPCPCGSGRKFKHCCAT